MTGVTIEVKVDDEDVKRAFLNLQSAMKNTMPVMQVIGTGLVGNIQRRLGNGVSSNVWPPLNPAYKATKRNKSILVESGALRGSISEQAGNDFVRVGTNKIYAAIHQFGGIITTQNAPALFFRLGSGFVRTKSVTIPARPFLTIEDEDERLIADIIFRFLQNKQ